jgi:hypothetical protein
MLFLFPSFHVPYTHRVMPLPLPYVDGIISSGEGFSSPSPILLMILSPSGRLLLLFSHQHFGVKLEYW